ncbi:glutaredoxin family protein [Kushneria phosphatilytica]|uniref:Glutaredoxin n=1 Tax=Kushneria phosphatilytica TaxID=657387 RepID=A0A1S1NVM1_9GAMM|nr:glutaredoxin [Kushneria phosphatilytica]OHV10586.1 glutaredoxin [Kushneria phosphatilytica]QEL11836.1 glutaredoxin [Kushneria phosphatilytica]
MGIVARTFFRGVRRALGPVMIANERLTRPQPVARGIEAQAEVDQACQSLALYQYRTCPFCIRVRKEMHRLALPIELRDIRQHERDRQALEAGGGRVKVPCLRIADETGEDEWMYESEEIKRYLQQRFEPATG